MVNTITSTPTTELEHNPDTLSELMRSNRQLAQLLVVKAETVARSVRGAPQEAMTPAAPVEEPECLLAELQTTRGELILLDRFISELYCELVREV